jgi:hypothetical protein
MFHSGSFPAILVASVTRDPSQHVGVVDVTAAEPSVLQCGRHRSI